MARVFLLVLAIGLLPLAVGAIVIQRGSHAEKSETLDRALRADAQAGSADLAAYFDRARAVALLTAANPVFSDFYTLPGSQRAKIRAQGRPVQRVNGALAYLHELYPLALGEACFIDRAGFENARVVHERPARAAELSTNESVHPFFKPTFQVGHGLVYQAAPYLSPDTYEWVISNSTVITTPGGLSPAIVHFEVTIESLRRMLALELGYHLLVIDRATGSIVADSERRQLPLKKLGHLDARFSELAHVNGLEGFKSVKGIRMAYTSVRRTATNANDWLVVAAGPAVSGPLIGINRPGARLLVLALLLVLIALPIAYRWGRLNENLTDRETDLAESEQRFRALFEEAEAGRRVQVELNERLRHLDRMKDDFVASVSHELRTPLTSISGYVELMIEGEAGSLNQEQLSFLGVVRRNADRLLRLVGDLLFAAQSDARQVEFEREPVDLLPLIMHAFEAARPAAADREIELALETESVGGLDGDAGRLGQMIDNLMSNALKFTPPGGTVSLRLAQRGDAAQIQIADTGMGISDDDQARLFERFFRTSAATEEAIQGTGLGLSIAAAIAEGHGGTIEVESEVGRGTTFTVVLPIVVVPRVAAA
jgi:signal transduction histidine kinase